MTSEHFNGGCRGTGGGRSTGKSRGRAPGRSSVREGCCRKSCCRGQGSDLCATGSTVLKSTELRPYLSHFKAKPRRILRAHTSSLLKIWITTCSLRWEEKSAILHLTASDIVCNIFPPTLVLIATCTSYNVSYCNIFPPILSYTRNLACLIAWVVLEKTQTDLLD